MHTRDHVTVLRGALKHDTRALFPLPCEALSKICCGGGVRATAAGLDVVTLMPSESGARATLIIVVAVAVTTIGWIHEMGWADHPSV